MADQAHFTKQEIAAFKALNAHWQRRAIEDWFKAANAGRMGFAMQWAENYACDLVTEETPAVAVFDLWFVVTQVYDVDLPNDVAECIAEGDSPRSWRNLLTRHGFPWRKFTKQDLEEIGASGLI